MRIRYVIDTDGAFVERYRDDIASLARNFPRVSDEETIDRGINDLISAVRKNRSFVAIALMFDDVGAISRRVVGVAVLNIVSSISRDFGLVESVSVDNEYRRQGIAAMLMKKLMRRAQSLKLDFLILGVDDDNVAATTLYKKNGFEEAVGLLTYYRHLFYADGSPIPI